MKWKPLIASLIVIAVALAAMAIYAALKKPAGGSRTPATNGPAGVDGFDGKYINTPLEDLPELDPLGLWPRHNQRLASAEIWVMWETAAHSECRLLGSRDHRDWYVLGDTAGTRHFLPTNLAYFDSQLTFMVEFEASGERYRSAPRTVFFGKGASFGQRRYKYRLGDDHKQTWGLELLGSDATTLAADAFLSVGFTPEELQTAARGTASDSVEFGVYNADVIVSGTSGFLEVYDSRALTYDRVLIELAR
jgi:hypothetical protein